MRTFVAAYLLAAFATGLVFAEPQKTVKTFTWKSFPIKRFPPEPDLTRVPANNRKSADERYEKRRKDFVKVNLAGHVFRDDCLIQKIERRDKTWAVYAIAPTTAVHNVRVAGVATTESKAVADGTGRVTTTVDASTKADPGPAYEVSCCVWLLDSEPPCKPGDKGTLLGTISDATQSKSATSIILEDVSILKP